MKQVLVRKQISKARAKLAAVLVKGQVILFLGEDKAIVLLFNLKASVCAHVHGYAFMSAHVPVLCVFMCVYVRLCVFVYLCMLMWRPEADVRCVLHSPFCFLGLSLAWEPGNLPISTTQTPTSLVSTVTPGRIHGN